MDSECSEFEPRLYTIRHSDPGLMKRPRSFIVFGFIAGDGASNASDATVTRDKNLGRHFTSVLDDLLVPHHVRPLHPARHLRKGNFKA